MAETEPPTNPHKDSNLKPKEDVNDKKPEEHENKDEKKAAENNDDNKQNDAGDKDKKTEVGDDSKEKECAKDDDKPATDFSGTWILKSSSKSIDEYYKSEGWGYMMRKMAPMIPIKQIIKQNGNKIEVNVIVGPGGKFANETSQAIIGSAEETEFKDKDGLCRSVSRWNDEKTMIISDMYRVDDEKRKYKSVRALSVMTDKKMIITTTNHHGKELVQNFERV
eukprot:838391_1